MSNTGAPVPDEPDYQFWAKLERFNNMIVAVCLACDINPDRYPGYIDLPTKPWAVLKLLEEHTRRNLESPVTREELRAVCKKMGLKPKLFYPKLRTKTAEKPTPRGDLNLIGALARLYWEEVGDGTDNVNQTEIIEALMRKFGKAYGMKSPRTLQPKLSAALKSLKDSLDK